VSWFQDDFYSTKVSKRTSKVSLHQGREHSMQGNRIPKELKMIGITLASMGFGMLLMMLILAPSGNSGTAEEGSLPATASVDQPNEMNNGSVEFSDKIVSAVEKVNPAVVSVMASESDEDFEAGEYGIGSGVIFDKDGDTAKVVTNNHVVQFGTLYRVVLSNGEQKKAKLLGQDVLSDLAVLEIEADDIEDVAEFGDSDDLKVGQTAIAIGNPLGLGFTHTITVGVISSTQRTVPVSLMDGNFFDWEMEVIQTDAAINQGNSGGALVNIQGQVIGINSMKIADFGVEGLGFALPINDVKPIVESLIEHGKVKRPFIGVYSNDLSDVASEGLDLPKDVKAGIVVVNTTGPAKKSGLKASDVIIKLDGQPIRNTLELRKYLYMHKQIGEELVVSYYRDGDLEETVLVLGELEDE
jgi:serine protease Do